MIERDFWNKQEIIWEDYKAFCGRTQLEPTLESFRAFSGGYRAASEVRVTSKLALQDQVLATVEVDGKTMLVHGRVVRFPQDAPDWVHIRSDSNGCTYNVLQSLVTRR